MTSPSFPPQPSPGVPRTVKTVKPREYAVTSTRGADAANLGVIGGGGLLQTQGASGMTRVSDCSIDQVSTWYGIYCGAFPISKVDEAKLVNTKGQPDPKGKPLSLRYEERYTDRIEILRVQAVHGSGLAALARFVAFNQLVIDGKLPDGTRCKWVDTDANSFVQPDGTRAVKNAVLRIHHGGIALVKNMSFAGDVYLGPMVEGDGGINANGEERKYRDAERLHNLVIEDCDFDAVTFKMAPAITSATLRRCNITAQGSTVIDTPWPYMNRPLSNVVLEDCQLKSRSTQTPKPFSGPGAANFRMIRGSVGG